MQFVTFSEINRVLTVEDCQWQLLKIEVSYVDYNVVIVDEDSCDEFNCRLSFYQAQWFHDRIMKNYVLSHKDNISFFSYTLDSPQLASCFIVYYGIDKVNILDYQSLIVFLFSVGKVFKMIFCTSRYSDRALIFLKMISVFRKRVFLCVSEYLLRIVNIGQYENSKLKNSIASSVLTL